MNSLSHHQLEVIRRENCESLNDYLNLYKAICDELAAIASNKASTWYPIRLAIICLCLLFWRRFAGYNVVWNLQISTGFS